jgi:hypothetical protein
MDYVTVRSRISVTYFVMIISIKHLNIGKFSQPDLPIRTKIYTYTCYMAILYYQSHDKLP